MKSPKIEIYKNAGKNYILFGISDRIEFPNKTLAKSYVYDLKKLIRDIMYLLSSIQSSTYLSYSSNYFHIDNSLNRKIQSSLNNFETQRDLIYSNYSSGNDSFIFSSINGCFKALEYSLILLKEYAQKNKQFALKNEIYSLLRHLSIINKTYDSDKIKLNIDFSIRNKKIKVINLINSEKNAI